MSAAAALPLPQQKLLRFYHLAAKDLSKDQAIRDFQMVLRDNILGTPYPKESYMDDVDECRRKLQDDPMTWRGPMWVLGSTIALERHAAKPAEKKPRVAFEEFGPPPPDEKPTKKRKKEKKVDVNATAQHYQTMVGEALNELCRDDWPRSDTAVVENTLAALEQGAQEGETFDEADIEMAVQVAREFKGRIQAWAEQMSELSK